MAAVTIEAPPVPDKRISRSRRAIRKAFIDLSREGGIDGFTVNDLCERADVNRGTFYNHFRDKDQLMSILQCEFMEGLEAIRDEMAAIDILDLAKMKLTSKPLPQLVHLFDYLRQESDFLCVMLGSGGDAKFGGRFKDTLCREFITGLLHRKYRENPTAFVNYYIAFYSAAYLGVITEWLNTGMAESSEEMARIAMRLLFIAPGESIVL